MAPTPNQKVAPSALERLAADRDWEVRRAALRMMWGIEKAPLAQHADAILARLADQEWQVRQQALQTLSKLEPGSLAQHADAVLARLADPVWQVRRDALFTLCFLEPASLAPHADAVHKRLEDSHSRPRLAALCALGKLEPATLAQYAECVAAKLEASDRNVRSKALDTLGKLEPAALAQYAEAVAAKLQDSAPNVCCAAVKTLGKLEPATLAQHADAVASRIESHQWDWKQVSLAVLDTLAKLEPATLVMYADAVIAMLGYGDQFQDEEEGLQVRIEALKTLAKLPATLAQHANGVIERLAEYVWEMRLAEPEAFEPATLAQHAEHADATVARLDESRVRPAALDTLSARFSGARHDDVLRAMDIDIRTRFNGLCKRMLRSGAFEDLRSQLRGRLRWYRCRLRWRVQRLVLYWYALPYRPSGPGHARDVEAWDRMVGNRDLGSRDERQTSSTSSKKRQMTECDLASRTSAK